MKRAFRGRVDPDTWNHVERIGKESENFLLQLTSPYRPSDKDFPRIIYNNRWVFGVWRNEGMFLEIFWKGVSLVDFFFLSCVKIRCQLRLTIFFFCVGYKGYVTHSSIFM